MKRKIVVECCIYCPYHMRSSKELCITEAGVHYRITNKCREQVGYPIIAQEDVIESFSAHNDGSEPSNMRIMERDFVHKSCRLPRDA